MPAPTSAAPTPTATTTAPAARAATGALVVLGLRGASLPVLHLGIEVL
jgi:hypothetical protein